MNRRVRLVVLVCAAALLAGVAATYAQESVVADIPYKFMAGGKVYAAGSYQVRLNDDQMGVQLTPVKGAAAEVLAVTRLAEPEKGAAAHLVFDKVGDIYYLSEAWFPGEDGIVLHSTKEKHTHATVKLHKKNA